MLYNIISVELLTGSRLTFVLPTLSYVSIIATIMLNKFHFKANFLQTYTAFSAAIFFASSIYYNDTVSLLCPPCILHGLLLSRNQNKCADRISLPLLLHPATLKAYINKGGGCGGGDCMLRGPPTSPAQ